MNTLASLIYIIQIMYRRYHILSVFRNIRILKDACLWCLSYRKRFSVQYNENHTPISRLHLKLMKPAIKYIYITEYNRLYIHTLQLSTTCQLVRCYKTAFHLLMPETRLIHPIERMNSAYIYIHHPTLSTSVLVPSISSNLSTRGHYQCTVDCWQQLTSLSSDVNVDS